jgi:hypothetical protein
MTEKIGLIKNPLTIIAIFAGIAEVSGTIVLPFISETNQLQFIYFLIIFPSLLVILFFITLNFNNKVLYAPSDYKNEDNYIRINKFDISRQKSIEVVVSKNESNEKEIIQLNKQEIKTEQKLVTKVEISNSDEIYYETIGFEFLVTDFSNANKFVKRMEEFGISYEIYQFPGDINEVITIQEHRAIWLGSSIQLELAQLIIKESKIIFPHLKYIKLFEGNDSSSRNAYIGGSTESAVTTFNCKPLKDSDFNFIETFKDIDSLHDFIRKFSK